MKIRLKPIREQVVVLMGASSGIGRQAALDFASRGARVVLSARDREGLDSVAQEIRARGGTVATRVADTSVFEEVEALGQFAVSEFGGIDTWVQLAAVSIYAKFEQTTPEEWRRVIDVNLNGQAFGAMVALPWLKRGGRGALICISSVEARCSLPYQSVYAASKHGITGMVDALRLELAHDNIPISVTEIMPASINTPFFEKARTKIGVKPTGVPPMYDPKDVSEAILYAAEHPIREFTVGGAGKLLKWSQEFSPGLADRFLLKVAFSQQKTEEPRSWRAPDNLWSPMPEHSRVHGSGPSHRASYNVIEKHPMAAKLVAIGAIAAAVTLWFRESGPAATQASRAPAPHHT